MTDITYMTFMILAVLPAYIFGLLMYRDKVEAYKLVDRIINPPPHNFIPLASLQNMLKHKQGANMPEIPAPEETVKVEPNFTYL